MIKQTRVKMRRQMSVRSDQADQIVFLNEFSGFELRCE
jgi:hypothetical protein